MEKSSLPHSSSCQMRKNVIGCEDYDELTGANLLVVGAGGIGCELMKNLVLTGFHRLSVVDMDTIDPSNLNRQLLFRRKDVGLSKAEVAKQQVLKINPMASVKSYHTYVQDKNFGVDWFDQYDIVLNALDNIDARKHVNRICSTIGKPLIESGSAGFNGQVFPIVSGETLCYECEEKPRQKSFPVCTIRQTPTKPEHCVAWAKLIYELIFGAENEDNILSDMKKDFLKAQNNYTDDENSRKEYAQKLFNHLFYDEMENSMSLINREKPPSDRLQRRAIKFEGDKPLVGIECHLNIFSRNEDASSSNTRNAGNSSNTHTGEPNQVNSGNNVLAVQQIWSLKDCFYTFRQCVCEMLGPLKESLGTAVFDKNDAVAMDFVTAAANVRMYNFGIPRLSRWHCQSIAGAIIPAVASTNAIVAAVQVVQLLHTLKYIFSKKTRKSVAVFDEVTSSFNGNSKNTRSNGDSNVSDDRQEYEKGRKRLKLAEGTPMPVWNATSTKTQETFRDSKARHVWIKSCSIGSDPHNRGKVMLAEPLDPPKKRCLVCSDTVITVKLRDFKLWTLQQFLKKIIFGSLGCCSPNVDTSDRNIYDHEEFAENNEGDSQGGLLGKTLDYWEIQPGDILTITDFSQGSFQCSIVLQELETENIGEGAEENDFLITNSSRKDTAQDEAVEENAVDGLAAVEPL